MSGNATDTEPVASMPVANWYHNFGLRAGVLVCVIVSWDATFLDHETEVLWLYLHLYCPFIARLQSGCIVFPLGLGVADRRSCKFFPTHLPPSLIAPSNSNLRLSPSLSRSIYT